MKIRMRTLAAGPLGVLNQGEIYDLPSKIAQPLVDAGYAVLVEKASPVIPPELVPEHPELVIETAEAEPAPGHAVSPRGKKKRG